MSGLCGIYNHFTKCFGKIHTNTKDGPAQEITLKNHKESDLYGICLKLFLNDGVIFVHVHITFAVET